MNVNTNNLILNTDSYKLSHYLQYPPNTSNIFSYIEARWLDDEMQELYDRFLPDVEPVTIVLGVQAFIQEYLSKPITQADLEFADQFATAHGFTLNRKGWQYIIDKYDGYLPITIKSVREGTAVPIKNILVSVTTNDPEVFWLTSYIETALMRAIWYPTTIASRDFILKKIIKKYMDETADYEPVEMDFMLHDFGARGVSSKESAELGGMAHLVFFQGTDTISGALAAFKYYPTGGLAFENMPGFSIPASEHSTMTAWGEHREADAYANMLKQFGGEGKIVACVSDSYDIYNAVENIWGTELRNKVIENGARLVVRPDSGDPLVVPVEVVKKLMDKFGYETNSKGYKVLPPYLRVIQGDGINPASMAQILDNLKEAGLSASNIAFGMGSGMLQEPKRDNFGFAMKACATEINGEWHDTYKTASGKASKRGRLTLVQDAVTGEFRTIKITDPVKYHETNVMHTFYDTRPIEYMYTAWVNVRTEANSAL